MSSEFAEKVEAEKARMVNRRRAKTQKKPKGSYDIFVLGLVAVAALIYLVLHTPREVIW